MPGNEQTPEFKFTADELKLKTKLEKFWNKTRRKTRQYDKLGMKILTTTAFALARDILNEKPGCLTNANVNDNTIRLICFFHIIKLEDDFANIDNHMHVFYHQTYSKINKRQSSLLTYISYSSFRDIHFKLSCFILDKFTWDFRQKVRPNKFAQPLVRIRPNKFAQPSVSSPETTSKTDSYKDHTVHESEIDINDASLFGSPTESGYPSSSVSTHTSERLAARITTDRESDGSFLPRGSSVSSPQTNVQCCFGGVFAVLFAGGRWGRDSEEKNLFSPGR